MYLALNFNNFEKNNIMFSSKMKNNVLQSGFFHKIFYSDEFFTSVKSNIEKIPENFID